VTLLLLAAEEGRLPSFSESWMVWPAGSSLSGFGAYLPGCLGLGILLARILRVEEE